VCIDNSERREDIARARTLVVVITVTMD